MGPGLAGVAWPRATFGVHEIILDYAQRPVGIS